MTSTPSPDVSARVGDRAPQLAGHLDGTPRLQRRASVSCLAHQCLYSRGVIGEPGSPVSHHDPGRNEQGSGDEDTRPYPQVIEQQERPEYDADAAADPWNVHTGDVDVYIEF